MTPTEALKLIDEMPPHAGMSKINPLFTCEQVAKMVREAIVDFSRRSSRELYSILEKRVLQVVQNRRRPL